MRKHLWLGLFLLLAGCPGRTAPEPVYIGSVSPQSGRDKEVGEQIDIGILLAVQKANAEGNDILGRKLAVLHGDMRSEPDAAAPQAVRLAAINRVQAVMGGTTDDEAEKIALTLQSYHLPLVTGAGYAGQPAPAGVTCLGMAPAEHGKALAQFVANILKRTRVAVLTEEGDARSQILTEALVRELRVQAQAPSLFRFSEEGPFAATAKQLVAGKPEAIVLAGRARHWPSLHSDLLKEGLAADLLWLVGCDEGHRSLLSTLEGTEGVYVASAFAFDDPPPALKEFAANFEAQAKRPPDANAALAYECTRLLFLTFKEAKTLQGSKARTELAKRKNFDSLTGPLLIDDDRRAVRILYIIRLEKGQWKRQWEYNPQ